MMHIVAYSPKGDIFAIGSGDERFIYGIQREDCINRGLKGTLCLLGQLYSRRMVAHLLPVSDDGTILLWDVP